MSIVLNSSGGGSVTINEPATASNFTQTLPAATGDVMVSGNMPAFNASRTSGNQTVSSNTWTKASFDTENFDTNNCFASSTFTPTVAGYYQFNLQATASGTPSEAYLYLRKNGSPIAGAAFVGSSMTQWTGISSSVQYANGTTDYFEMYLYTSATAFGSLNFSGFLARTA